MKNLKVKTKLYGLSVVMIASLVFTSVMALSLMSDIYNVTDEITTNMLPSVIVAEELNTLTSDFRITEASHVISRDTQAMNKHEATLLQYTTEIESLFQKYEIELATDNTDLALLLQAHELWEQYLIVHADMITHSRDNDTEAAMSIMETQSEDLFDEVSELFLNLVQFNKSLADQASVDSKVNYQKATLILCGVLFIMGFSTLFASRVIIGGVIKPVKEIETAASKILTGDLSTKILYTSKDELGNLTGSMRELCQMFQGVIADLSQLLKGLSDGDFSVRSQKSELYVGEFAPLLELTNNISDKLSEALFQIHHRDALTGCYNRAGYSTEMDVIMNPRPTSLGVISVNINGLKHINENLGITAGDKHILGAAVRLKEHFGYEFFRMSGDEFVGIAPNVENAAFETQVDTLHTAMRQDENHDFSMGHAWGNKNFDLWKLMQEADTLMYINKQEYYASTKREFNQVDDGLLSDLLSYLADGEFMIYLQPQVKLKDGSLHGAEALIRRFDKTNQKMVFPDQFIPLYEMKSIIRHVDMFVLETVCSLLSAWTKEGKAIPISVNLSRVTLLEHGIVTSIVEICDRYQVPHNLVVIEVTERVGLIENNVASALITAFKDHGFNISLDDFGCAYSNIVTLAQIEVDEVKIDKSLVDDLTTNNKNHILVKNVLSMCNELEGASTLAEGIEDEHQAKLLKELGCHLGQGYFYSRPIPVPEFVEKYLNLLP